MVIPEDPPEVNLGSKRPRRKVPKPLTGWQQLVINQLLSGYTVVKFAHEGRALIGLPGRDLRPLSKDGRIVTISMQTIHSLVDRRIVEEKSRSPLFTRYGLVDVCDENEISDLRRGGDAGPGRDNGAVESEEPGGFPC